MSENRTFADYGSFRAEDAPPLVKRKAVVWSPTAPDKPAGFVGYDLRREHKVYTTRRKQYHYYYEGEGWAISDRILDTLDKNNIPRVAVWEHGSGDVHEFQTRAYTDRGSEVPEHELLDADDPQTYVPESEELHVYPGVGEDLHSQSFEKAMDRLANRSGWLGK